MQAGEESREAVHRQLWLRKRQEEWKERPQAGIRLDRFTFMKLKQEMMQRYGLKEEEELSHIVTTRITRHKTKKLKLCSGLG